MEILSNVDIDRHIFLGKLNRNSLFVTQIFLDEKAVKTENNTWKLNS